MVEALTQPPSPRGSGYPLASQLNSSLKDRQVSSASKLVSLQCLPSVENTGFRHLKVRTYLFYHH